MRAFVYIAGAIELFAVLVALVHTYEGNYAGAAAMWGTACYLAIQAISVRQITGRRLLSK